LRFKAGQGKVNARPCLKNKKQNKTDWGCGSSGKRQAFSPILSTTKKKKERKEKKKEN
jgi:hypothetical protein